MLTTAYYFLQVLLCSALMMGYYWLVLRNKRFHQYNRFYLLMVAIVSWLVPLIKIQWGHTEAIQFLNVVADNNSQLDVIIADKGFRFSWDLLAISIYCIVAGILLVGMLHALYRLYHLLKTHSCKSVGEVYLIFTQAKGTPFSFFRYIFWNEEIDIRSESGKQILQHELTHVQEKHSFDKVLIQLVLIGGWFNPFFWMIKKELEMIHEFIADRKAVKDGDTASLAQMLLASIYPQQQFALTNPFFFSPIKRRLKMLANQQNPKFSYMRRLVVLPLLAIVVVLFAFRNKQEQPLTLSVASVMENVVEKGKQLITVQNIPRNPIAKNDTIIIQADTVYIHGKDKDDVVKIVPVNSGINADKPLIVLDGKKVPFSVMNTLDQNQISSIDVLKGNSATSTMYGEEGKNGIILITTKEQALKKPLMLIDFKKVTKEDADKLDPKDIATVDVLKNERSKAIYGEEGKNGVVLITTKAYADAHNASSSKPNSMPKALFILDGVKTDSSILKTMDPNQIQSIDIRKGEMAKAMYGEEGANGVIMITSKPKVNTYLKSTPKVSVSDIDMGNATVIGYNENNDPGKKEFLERNPSVKNVYWWAYKSLKMEVELKDGSEEVYDLSKPESKQKAISKYGKLPTAPPPPPPTTRNTNTSFAEGIEVSDVKLEKTNYQPNTTYKGRFPKVEVKPHVNVNSSTNVDTHTTLVGVKADATTNVNTDVKVLRDTVKEVPKVFTVSQEPASFPGGEEAWQKYLQAHRSSMDIVAEKGGPPGTYKVVVSFIVDKEGNLSDVKAENDPGYGTKDEAIKLISKGPKWIPAKQNGKLVVYRAKKTITWVVTEEGKKSEAKTKAVIRDTVKAGTKKISVPQVLAEFRGGEEAWQKYLHSNKNLDMVVKNGAGPGTYKVYVHFVVGADGTVSDVGTTNDPGYGTKAEAIRIIAKGPKWKPGLLNGQPVTTFNIKPITWVVSE